MSKKQFLENAIASLKLLRKKALSDNERAFLMQFPGSGILKECGVFTDADKPQWLKDGRAELQELLDCHEWSSLQNAGMQNAHYTAPSVRQAIWNALVPFLREKDKILDPGCGIGGFYIEMPSHLKLTYVGVEKDCVSSAIAKLAHPEANIYHKDFLKWSYPQQFNLVIGNVPFTNGVESMNLDGEWLRIGLHAQFFVNAIAHLAPRGLLAFLTSVSTLDARTPDYIQFREWVHSKCEFLGAVRLPNQGTHQGGTEVTTDLILLRRREVDVTGTAQWLGVGKSHIVGYGGEPAYLSNWYLTNPQYLIGEPVCSNLRGKNGNPTTAFALQPYPNQDVLGELRQKLNLILCKEVNIEPTFIEKVDLGITWHTTFEYEYLGQRFWVRDSPGMPFFVSLASTFEEFHNIELVQCPADVGLQEQAVVFAHSYFKGEVTSVPLWDLKELKHEDFVYKLYLFTIPKGYIVLWETSDKGHWFAVDKNELNIKRSGNYKFLGDDPFSIALKAYNWYLSDLTGDYFPDHPFVGKPANGRSLGTGEMVQGTITLVNPDGEEITHVVIATGLGEYTCDRWELIEDSNQNQQEDNDMATLIPAEKFKSSSVYAFILRQNPKQSGIEIHFPPDCQMDGDNAIKFIARVMSAGFRQANKNPKLYYATYSEELWQKARSWVQSCKTFDAYELDADEPVDKTPSRRRYGSSATKEAAATPPAAPNKLLDAIASLLDNKVDPLAENIASCIVERLKSEHRDTKAFDKLKGENEKLIAERDALVKDSVGLTQMLEKEREQLKQLQESYCNLENRNKQMSTYCEDAKTQLTISGEEVAQFRIDIAKLQIECDGLRSQLQEFGLEPESEPSAPTFEDDSEPQFADESEEASTEPVFADESDKPRFDDEEESGFDFDALEGK